MKQQLILLDFVIYIFSLFYLLIDTVGGILISKGLPNIGQAYKFFLILMMSISVIAKKRNGILIISGSLALLTLTLIFPSVSNHAIFSQTAITGFKIQCVFVMYLYFSEFEFNEKLKTVILFNYFVFIANIVLGILGFGTPMREGDGESFGTRGFFCAGNEVSYTFICLTFLILYLSSSKKLFLYLVSILFSLCISTKACILAVFLLVVSDVFFDLNLRKKIRFSNLIVLGIIVFIIIYFRFLSDLPVIKFMEFKFKQHQRGDFPILNALLSGRVERVPMTNLVYENQWSFWKFLFGMGFPNAVPRMELDFLELFYYYGFLMLSIVLLFYIELLIRARSYKLNKVYVFNIICLLMSFMVGHVIYSLMGGFFFALINGILVNRNDKIYLGSVNYE